MSPPGLRRGVLLVNLGTPEAPTVPAVRRFLAEFLSDPRLIDIPRWLWLPLLHGVILSIRPQKTAEAYAQVWRADTGESPLRFHTRRQAERLAERLGRRAIVDWAMRYGSPSIADRLAALRAQGATEIVVVPLYPQYSLTTNDSVADAVSAAGGNAAQAPKVLPAFFDHPKYIDALRVETVRRLATLDAAPERVVLSYHGLPKRYVDRGDPYFDQCVVTSRLLRAAMGWSEDFAPMTFQSKFGPGRWLEPSTEKTIETLAERGVRNIAVLTPGFVADCVETLEEIALEARDAFVAAGGSTLVALPCLNESDAMIELLEALVLEAVGSAAAAA
ncbi:MAG: ferrochelatase [Parvularculaceae bacterium]|nr:ferrochelatase [Parvularculaceae bacterium]